MLALVLAAGRGRRFSADRPKQFTRLAGRPVICWSVEIFHEMPEVDRLGVLVPEEYRDLASDLLAAEDLNPDFIVSGGDSRRESVLRGLRKGDAEDFLRTAIHDAARPNLRAELMYRLLEQLKQSSHKVGGVVPGHTPVDTVKHVRSTEDGIARVQRTLDRSSLRSVQTPQLFYAKTLVDVHESWFEGESVTDDASMLEDMGHTVQVLNGPRDNLKLTHPEDRPVLEALLKNRDSK